MTTPALRADEAEQLAREGWLILPGAVPPDLLAQARAAFEAGYLPSDRWPVPRGIDWRHAQVDLDPAVQAICRLPALLAAVGRIVGQPFFLMQVEGREPLPGKGAQPLHRDAAGAADRYAAVLVYLDDFGPDNGATALVPGSHLPGREDTAGAFTASGEAGDILLLDANLLHGATCNASGAPRRTFLASYTAAHLRQSLQPTEALRGVRMDTSEVFAAP
ncbi:MAG: phytanoyl-CoA dioxygenase family protein [Novosphingobium sp.]|nr:phytanoyl-CoA dioxygenase family protein [Novosphingobium sp.]